MNINGIRTSAVYVRDLDFLSHICRSQQENSLTDILIRRRASTEAAKTLDGRGRREEDEQSSRPRGTAPSRF